jgi:hypothetical protein
MSPAGGIAVLQHLERQAGLVKPQAISAIAGQPLIAGMVINLSILLSYLPLLARKPL